MAKVKKIGPQEYSFICPACEVQHIFDSRWTFNGDFNRPTFFPSLDFTGGKYDEDENWTDLHCHSYVENGQIRFLNDCSHEFAGHTMALPHLPIDSEEQE